MRNLLTIGIFLLALGLVLALTMRQEPYDPLVFNPDDIPISNDLKNPNGNVLWISVEGLRSDHMGTYGYQNITTPRIDSLASESLVFQRCYAQSTEAYRNMATMLSSQYPSAYPSGARGSTGKGFRDLLSNPDSSLIEFIREKGLTTAAIVANPLLKKEFGFSVGFDYYNDESIMKSDNTFRNRDASETCEAASNWLSKNFRRPFFLLVHFSDPQGPYDPPPNFVSQLSEMRSYGNPTAISVAKQDIRPVNALPSYHGKAFDGKPIGEMKRLYDGEVAEVDYYVGELLETLGRLNIDKETLVVISGLHGESFGEHGLYFSSGGPTYRCLTQVPLIIRNPHGNAGRIKDIVEGIDIMPTILSYLDIESKTTLSGMNLLRFHKKPFVKWEYPAFSCWDDPKVTSVIRGDYELISFDNKQFKLYNLKNDPDELYDLYTDNDPTAEQLKMLLEAWDRQNHEKALEKEIKEKYNPSSSRKTPMIVPEEHLQRNPK